MLCLKYQTHFLVSFLYVDFSQVNVAALPPSVILPLFQKYLTGKRTSSGQQINFQSPINHNRCILVVHPNQQKEVGKMQKKKKGWRETIKRCAVREISAKLMRNQVQVCASLYKTIQLYFVQRLSSKVYPKTTLQELNNTVTEINNSRGRAKLTDMCKSEKIYFAQRFGMRSLQEHWSVLVLAFF